MFLKKKTLNGNVVYYCNRWAYEDFVEEERKVCNADRVIFELIGMYPDKKRSLHKIDSLIDRMHDESLDNPEDLEKLLILSNVLVKILDIIEVEEKHGLNLLKKVSENDKMINYSVNKLDLEYIAKLDKKVDNVKYYIKTLREKIPKLESVLNSFDNTINNLRKDCEINIESMIRIDCISDILGLIALSNI